MLSDFKGVHRKGAFLIFGYHAGNQCQPFWWNVKSAGRLDHQHTGQTVTHQDHVLQSPSLNIMSNRLNTLFKSHFTSIAIGVGAMAWQVHGEKSVGAALGVEARRVFHRSGQVPPDPVPDPRPLAGFMHHQKIGHAAMCPIAKQLLNFFETREPVGATISICGPGGILGLYLGRKRCLQSAK